MSSFIIYVIGFVIVTIGLIIGAVMLNVPTAWIVVGSIIFIGVGVLSGVTTTRRKDPNLPDDN